MIKEKLVIILVIVAAATDAVAASSELLTILFRRDSPEAILARSFYQHNPATMYYRDTLSISSAYLGYDYGNESRSLIEQTGSGNSEFHVSAESYYRLSPNTTVWGSAEYTVGNQRDVKWSNVIDYTLLAPYILGDSVGGNLNSQRYAFTGGWSSNYGHWTVGLTAGYRAEIASRSHDPRVKDVVSDLEIAAGTACSFGDVYLAGANLGVRIYNQESDVDFQNPMNDTQTFPLTGLGTYYNRFVGNATGNCGYTVTSYKTGLQLLTRDHSGFKFNVDYVRTKASEQMRDYNNITLGYTWTDNIIAVASYRFNLTQVLTIVPKAEVNLMSRNGTEQLFGSVIGGSYDKIGLRPNYSAKIAYWAVGLPVEYSRGLLRLTATPGFTSLTASERLREPLLKKSFDVSTANLDFNMQLLHHKWLWSLDLNGGYGTKCRAIGGAVKACRSTRVGVVGVSATYDRYELKHFNTANYISIKIDFTF